MSKTWIPNPDGTGGFYSCECVRDIWPLVNELARKRGIVKHHIDVTQGSYTSSFKGSALTHAGGGVLDIRQTGKALDDLLEECGFADFERDERDGFSRHSHILLRHCKHLHWQAAAQVTSWWRRRNGLVNNRADRDQTRPAIDRGLSAGKAWLLDQLGLGVTAANAARLRNTTGKGRPLSYSATLGKSAGNRQIIQRILQRQGYYEGKIDGAFGPQFYDGLRRWREVVYKTKNPKVTTGELGYNSFVLLARWDGWKAVK